MSPRPKKPPTDDKRLHGLKLALRNAPSQYEQKLVRLRDEIDSAPREYEIKLATIRAEILSIELGGATAPVAAEAWARVRALEAIS